MLTIANISRHDREIKAAKLDSAGYPSEYALSNGCFRQMLGLPESPPLPTNILWFCTSASLGTTDTCL